MLSFEVLNNFVYLQLACSDSSCNVLVISGKSVGLLRFFFKGDIMALSLTKLTTFARNQIKNQEENNFSIVDVLQAGLMEEQTYTDSTLQKIRGS